jgi:hypothetical protein
MAANIEGQPNMVQLEYGTGHGKIGLSDRCTIRMLKNEFFALIGDDWSIYPSISYSRLTDGSVLHRTVGNFAEVEGAIANDLMFELPGKFQEDGGRGTEINLRTDQLRVLDYWGQAGQTAIVGVSPQIDNHTVEY